MRLLLLLCLALPAPALAQTPPILQALRLHAWPLAEALAAANPDPLAAKLITFIRLLQPGQAAAAELQHFIVANPGWPSQPILAKRYGEALVAEPDEDRAKILCAALPPPIFALPRCAEAWALAGQAQAAISAARAAWTAGALQGGDDPDFLARWGQNLTATDQRQRFDNFEAAGPDAASRQLPRLEPPYRALATARLALRRATPEALSTLQDVPAASRADPALLLAEARYLRRAGADTAALALWRSVLPQAEAAIPQDSRAPFWAEREALARHLLGSGDNASAYALASDTALPPDQTLDAEFLAGWIALRRLHDPAQARAHFLALGNGAHSAITQARAAYWLARAQTDAAAATSALNRAAAWPTTYYGQLALRAQGQSDTAIDARIAALSDPPTSQAEEAELARSEMGRAAAILVSWSDPGRAGDFLRQLIQPPATTGRLAATSLLALRLALPDVAVQAARLAGRDGVVLAASGWPLPVQPPGPLPPSLTLAVMRQESSFDPRIVSAAGAQGLMQLLPATAAQMARTQHVAAGPLTDAEVNMALGTAYLGTLLTQFAGNQALAIVAYNAGPHRVRAWIAAAGAPAGDTDSLIDWIELIPYAETRNYVQRVLENELIYRAKLQGAG